MWSPRRPRSRVCVPMPCVTGSGSSRPLARRWSSSGPRSRSMKSLAVQGVGNATLYRHFADRLELIHHVTLSVMSRTADRAESALAEEPDAFQALRRFVHTAVEERIGALCPLLSDGIDPAHPELLAARERLEAAVEAVMGAARDSGQLRTDIAVGDLMVALTQLTRPLAGQWLYRLRQVRAPAPSAVPGRHAGARPLRTPRHRRHVGRPEASPVTGEGLDGALRPLSFPATAQVVAAHVGAPRPAVPSSFSPARPRHDPLPRTTDTTR